MTMNYKLYVTQYVMDIFTLCRGKMIESEKDNKKVQAKDKWEIIAIIPLIPIVGVNHRLPILHTSKRMVHCYTTVKNINQFAIGYVINPSLNFNNEFITQVEKCLGVSFSIRTMKTINNCLMKNNTCVMAPMMIYENNGGIPKKLYRVLCCVFYTLIENCFCIDYLSCQPKNLNAISYNPTFEYKSFNILLGIGIIELLLKLVSCHGFRKKKIQP